MTDEITIDVIQAALQSSWNAKTCYKGWYDASNPPKGQCAVSAYVVKRLLGGTVIKARMSDGTSHYFNWVNGVGIDTTWEQFKDGQRVAKVQEAAPNPSGDTKKRFDLLWQGVLNYLCSTGYRVPQEFVKT